MLELFIAIPIILLSFYWLEKSLEHDY